MDDDIFGYGWFSKKQQKVVGSHLCLRIDGAEVVVTQVTGQPDTHGTAFDDVKYVGILKRHIKHIPPQRYINYLKEGKV